MTYVPNTIGRAVITRSVAADATSASAASCVSFLPECLVTENANNGIKVILVLVKPGITAKKKRKNKKLTPVAGTDDASAGTLTPSTAPAMKKAKMTNKKKAAKPIDLIKTPMYVITTNSKKRPVAAISHGQKWVIGNSETITGDVANEPSSDCWWHQKGPNGNNMMPPEQLTLLLELTNKRLMEKGKKELTHQELLQWLGDCKLIGSIIVLWREASSGSAAALPPSSSLRTTCARCA